MPDVFVYRKKNPAPIQVAKDIEHGNKVTFFSNFVENPTNISFHHKEKDEKILLFLRSHLITNTKWLTTGLIFALIPLIFLIISAGQLPFPALPTKFTMMILFLYFLGLFAFLFSSFLTWYFNIFVITNKRVIDIDFMGLVFHDVAETQFTLLQDVNYTQSGTIRHFFNYGDVFAQTAGGKENLEALGVPKPAKVTTFITQNMAGKRYGSI